MKAGALFYYLDKKRSLYKEKVHQNLSLTLYKNQ